MKIAIRVNAYSYIIYFYLFKYFLLYSCVPSTLIYVNTGHPETKMQAFFAISPHHMYIYRVLRKTLSLFFSRILNILPPLPSPAALGHYWSFCEWQANKRDYCTLAWCCEIERLRSLAAIRKEERGIWVALDEGKTQFKTPYSIYSILIELIDICRGLTSSATVM